MDLKLFLTTFAAIFVAELGDKTQLAALSLASSSNSRWTIFFASSLALIATSAIAVLAVVMVVRRAGEYAFVRPGREMLWTAVSDSAKYKAKNFVDTVVYRGGDAVSAWLKAGIDMLATQPALAMLLGAGLALGWAANGQLLARAHRRIEADPVATP